MKPPAVDAKQPSMEIRTDCSALAKILNVPTGIRACRWSRLPRGTPGLGPSDYVLHVYLELDEAGMKAFEQPSGNTPATMHLPENLAQALLPEQLHSSAVPVSGSWRISGYEVNAQPLERMPYRVDEAVRLPAGLLLTASTR